MNTVVSSLSSGEQGVDVVNLQEALKLFVENQRIPMQDRARETHLSDLEGERAASTYGDATARLVRLFRRAHGLGDGDDVDGATADAMNALLRELGVLDEERPFRVGGSVRTIDGDPVTEGVVCAFDVDLRVRAQLGEETLDADKQGRYEITFGPNDLTRSGKPAADLWVEVVDRAGERLADSGPVLFGAPSDATVDILVPRSDRVAPAEFDEIERQISPLLRGVDPADLVENDERQEITFVAEQTGRPLEQVERLAASARIGRAIQESLDEAILPSVLYAWMRERPSGDLDWLARRGEGDLRDTLSEAVRLGAIAPLDDEQIERAIGQLREFRQKWLLEPAPDGSPASIGDLLGTMPRPLSRERQLQIAELIDRDREDAPGFRNRLQEAGLEGREAADVERTLRLGRLTRRHAPMTAALQALAGDDDEASLRGLASVRYTEWIDLAYRHGAPAGAPMGPIEYANQMAAEIETLHPTAVLQSRLTHAELTIDRPGFEFVATFLEKNPGFDILTSSVEAAGRDGEFEGIPESKQPVAIEALLAAQRVKRLGATWDEAAILIGADLTSAHRIVRLGREHVRREIGDRLGADRADAFYASAKLLHDATVAFSTDVISRSASDLPAALRELNVSSWKALDDFPTLQGLLGSLDRCGCRDCQSVLSPSAYLVDLLETIEATGFAAEELQSRRPDLWDLDLTCANANVEVPFVDLVLEILESAVVFPISISLPPSESVPAGESWTLPPAVVNWLKETAPDAASDLTAFRSKQSRPSSTDTIWTVSDRQRHWSIRQRQANFFVRKKQTRYQKSMSLQRINPSTLSTHLDAGEIPINARSRIESLLTEQVSQHLRLSPTGYSITTIVPGRRWAIRYRLRAEIRIAPFNPANPWTNARLTIRSDTGQELAAYDWSVAVLRDITPNLDGGRIGTYLGKGMSSSVNLIVTKGLGVQTWIIESVDEYERELHYVPPALAIESLTYQSLDDQLPAAPALPNRNPLAYERLKDAVFPWTLPVDLPLLEMRALLDRGGQSRADLLKLREPARYLELDEFAREMFGLSAAEAALIAGARLPSDGSDLSALWAAWGVTPDSNGTVTVRDVSAGTSLTGTPLAVLSRVSILLQQARLTLPDLQQLLDCRFIQDAAGSGLSVAGGETCEPDKMQLAGLTVFHLDRIHRFVRLWRRTGWRIHELDLAIAALASPAGQLSGETLRGLAHLKLLERRLKMPIEVLAAWWGAFAARVYRDHSRDGAVLILPWYDRLFLGPTIQQPPDPDFVLTPDRRALVQSAAGKTISDKTEPVSAALGLKPADLHLLLTRNDLHGAPIVADQLTLEKLNQLFAIAGLCRALALPIRDFIALRRLSGFDPLVDTSAAIKFCDVVDEVRRSPFQIDQLAFLFDPASADVLSSSHPLAVAETRNRLKLIRDALSARRRDADGASGDSADGASGDSADGASGDSADSSSGDSADSADAQIAVDQIATIYAIDHALIEDLLLSRPQNAGDGKSPAIEALLALRFTNLSSGEAIAEAFPKAQELLLRLHRVALLATTFDLSVDELRLFAHAGRPNRLAGIDLNALPAEPASVATHVLIEGWRRLMAVHTMRQRIPGLSNLLTGYVAALDAGVAGQSDARAVIAVGMRLSPGTVEEAAKQLRIATLDDYRDPILLGRWIELLHAGVKIGANATQMDAFLSTPVTPAAVDTARHLIQAKHDTDRRHDLLKPIVDRLRDVRRDALVDYLIARDGLRTADDLYHRYLIDVQMAPCMTTTRTLQAISAVQLFVQRCLLNLEPDVSPAEIGQDRWEWMKQYRVWEANRRVFLHPENWLLPELRDNKTELFRQLEQALHQGEPSDERARNALLAYLDGLSDLAKIHVVGLYEHRPNPGDPRPRSLYVVGRTPDSSPQYYWRACEWFGDPRMQWSGWERIDLDIDGDCVVPVVFDGGFQIVWPVIREQEQPEGQPQNAKPSWEVRLAWSRYTPNGWTKKKVSQDSLIATGTPGVEAGRSFAFRAELRRIETNMSGVSEDSENAISVLQNEELYIHVHAGALPLDGVIPGIKHVETINLQPDPQHQSFPAALMIGGRCYVNVTGGHLPVPGVRLKLHVEPLAGDTTWAVDQVRSNLKIPSTGLDLFQTDSNGAFYHQLVATSKNMNSAMASVEFVVRADPGQGYKLNAIVVGGEKVRIDESKPDCHWNPTLIVSNANVELRYDRDGPLTFEPSGSFRFTQLGGVRADASWLPLQRVDGAEALGMGYRELPARSGGADFLRLGDDKELVPFWTTPGRFTLHPDLDDKGVDGRIWHYRDALGAYFLQERSADPSAPVGIYDDAISYVTYFMQAAARGLDSLFDPAIQQWNDLGREYRLRIPIEQPSSDSIVEQRVSFELRAPQAVYNWELFLHVPLLVADYFMQQQRFEEAQRWLHCVFNPTTDEEGDGSSRYWRFAPFRDNARPRAIEELLALLANPLQTSAEEDNLKNQIATWAERPFRPHAIGRMRTSAYQWRTLFRYLDLLIAWGDQRFRRETREAIDEATLLYVLAADLLGPRPQIAPAKDQTFAASYRALVDRWDEFGNAWVSLSDLPSFKSWLDRVGIVGPTNNTSSTETLTSIGTLYFCVPPNRQLQDYWDRVEHRLTLIRTCKNLDGVSRALPLWAPPIDPELLVRAVAAGIDLDDALQYGAANRPHYRFSVLIQKAQQLCAEVKSLGAALLAALEKRDTEELARLRSTHEIDLLSHLTQVRTDQVDQARADVDALTRSREAAVERYRHYQRLLGRPDVAIPAEGQAKTYETMTMVPFSVGIAELDELGMIPAEQLQLALMTIGETFSIMAGGSSALAGVMHMLIALKQEIRPWAEPVAHGLSSAADGFRAIASGHGFLANVTGIVAGYQRRRDDWQFQSNLAMRELAQIDAQLTAARLRVSVASGELGHHRRQIAHAKSIDEWLRDKYTNQELYSWMAGQLSNVYFSTYQLALEVAGSAEHAYRAEVHDGDRARRMIAPSYWNNLQQGLMAGERLGLDLQRMEVAYLDRNQRDKEITRHVSLVLHDPLALIELKTTGHCTFGLPEELFDLDYPGHYLRRIKSVSLTIPCVTGPYASINCTLTLLKSRTRVKATAPPRDYREDTHNDDRFEYSVVAADSIATSHGNRDSGLFELNFRDDRYLPFEGAGAISEWRLDMPRECNAFDFDTISDVILHLNYTARSRPESLRSAALAAAKDLDGSELVTDRLFSARHEFPGAWQRFQSPVDKEAEQQSLELDWGSERFPYRYRGSTIKIAGVKVFLLPADSKPEMNPREFDGLPVTLRTIGPTGSEADDDNNNWTASFGAAPDPFGPLPFAEFSIEEAKRKGPGQWRLDFQSDDIARIAPISTDAIKAPARIKAGLIRDILIVCHFETDSNSG